MNPRLKSALIISAVSLVALCLVAWLWSYVLSFQNVTFKYDRSLGYIELTSDASEPLYPPNGEEVRLKKGEYRLQTIGDTIKSNTRKITIDSSTGTISTDFDYSEEYLADLYQDERADIMAAIHDAYPHIDSLYTIKHGALYGRGNVFGARLDATQTGDNSDSLSILLQKKSGKWKLLSTPPEPILSAPDHPDIDAGILRKINQAK